MTAWRKAQNSRDARIAAGSKLAQGKVVNARDATALLEAVIRPATGFAWKGITKSRRICWPVHLRR